MCFHGVIKPVVNRSIFGSGWRKYGENMEVMNNACNTGNYRVKSNANKKRHSGVLVAGIYSLKKWIPARGVPE